VKIRVNPWFFPVVGLAALLGLCYFRALGHGLVLDDVVVVGAGADPRLWRALNVAVHFANALLVGALAARLVSRHARWPAAYLFAAHPIATGAVTYIAGREDALAALPLLGALVAFLDHRARPSAARAAAAIALGAVAAILSPFALALPVACALLDIAIGGARGAARRAPIDLALAAAVLAGALAVRPGLPEAAREALGATIPAARLAVGGFATAAMRDLALALWPAGLCADATFDAYPASQLGGAAAAAGLALAGAAAVALWRRGARVEAALGAIFLAVLAVPLAAPVREPLADRHAYLALAALVTIGARGLVLVARAGHVKIAMALLGAAVIAGAVRTLERNHVWRSDETVCASVVAERPECARAEVGVAAARLAANDAPGALEALDRALAVIRRAPAGDPAARLLLSTQLLRGEALRGRDEREAAVAFCEALAVAETTTANPAASAGERRAAEEARREAQVQLGTIAVERGDPKTGFPLLAAAAGPTPTAATERAWDALGRAALATKDFARAEEVYRALAAARLSGEKQAWYRLAQALDARADVAGARAALERAVALDPGFSAARFTLGDLELKLGELDAAEREFRAVAAEHPLDKKVRLKLAEIEVRRRAAAEDAARERAKPPPPPPLDAAAAARKKAQRLVDMARKAWSDGQPEGAIQALVAADSEDPTWAEPADLLGALLETVGRKDDAIRAYERALSREPGRESARLALERLKTK
jgi:tetratricopeptide (TPR) repeat protein